MDGELAQMLWALLTNPNVIYALFIIGLWSAASAIYVPGTGFLEAAALICLALVIVGLTRQPANVAGVILIVIAGVLFVIDLKVQSVALAVGAAISLVLGSVFLFPPTEPRALRVSPWLIGGVTMVSLVFFGVALAAAAQAQKMHVKMSLGTIVGQVGVVKSAIGSTGLVQGDSAVGTVHVQGELWTAVACEDEDVPLDVGTRVEVVALEGVRVRVRRKDA